MIEDLPKPTLIPSRPFITGNYDYAGLIVIKDAPKIVAEFDRYRLRKVSVNTVQRRLRQADFHVRTATGKPLLRRGNKQRRLQWAKAHKNWTEENFRKVLWSDESKFEVLDNRQVFVRRSAKERMLLECLVPGVKHGGCFSHGGIGDLDNDPKYTFELCKEYLKSQEDHQNLSVMVWAPQSPAINPMELLMDELDRMVRAKCPTSKY
ncbi:hypothetical protein Trydic_g4475 [Trypoxylus dichotomus]